MKRKISINREACQHRVYVVLGAVSLALMFITEWHMALAVVGAAVIGRLLSHIVWRHTRRYVRAKNEALSRLNCYAEEAYQGHDVVRLSRAARQVKENFRELNGGVYSASRRVQFWEEIRLVLADVTGNLSFTVVWISGAWMALMGEISLRVIAAFMLYVGVLVLSLNRLTKKAEI